MARIKYYYDTETCKYERVKVSTWDVVLNLMGFLSVSLILAIAIVIIYSTYFESPKEALLKKENSELVMHYEILEKNIQDLNNMMLALENRDDNVYRVIFEADPIPNSIRQAGMGGADRYEALKSLEREELIVDTYSKIDKLKKQMYIQTKSYDDLITMAQNKDNMWAAIPAIQPILNQELTRLASGFGMRIHPIYKVKKMHEGVDFSAPRGTPIYATGDGKVITVRNMGLKGYGKYVEIDHGYGYVTKYAHMDEFNVRVGQEIKRGECIGYVGNSGSSTAPHVHYEVIKDDKNINPALYFFQDISPEEYEKLLELASIENQSLS